MKSIIVLIKKAIYRFDYLFHKSRGSKVIFYHDVGKNYTDMGTPLEIIIEHIRVIREKGFSIVEDIDKKTDEVMICFDDGWAGLYDNRSYFIDNDIKPTVFLAVDLVGKIGYLNQSQIRELHRFGFHFEGHTWSHQDLTTFSKDNLVHEIVDSRYEIEKIVGDNITALCFPMGRYSDLVMDVAKDAGYSKLFSSINGCYNDLLEKDGIICRVLVQDVTPEDFQYILLSSSPYLQKRTKRLQFCD